MAGLPYDALTAALDAWLGQHIPHETRRERVRRAVDCLDDLRLAPLAHIEFATDVDRGHALDGAPGARGPSELPTLIHHRDGRRSGKHLPAREKSWSSTVIPPLPPSMLSFTLSLHRESEDLLLQLVHGDLVDLRVELALADLLARDAPVVLGHGSSRLRGHLRT